MFIWTRGAVFGVVNFFQNFLKKKKREKSSKNIPNSTENFLLRDIKLTTSFEAAISMLYVSSIRPRTNPTGRINVRNIPLNRRFVDVEDLETVPDTNPSSSKWPKKIVKKWKNIIFKISKFTFSKQLTKTIFVSFLNGLWKHISKGKKQTI